MARPKSKIDITCRNPDCEYFLSVERKDIQKLQDELDKLAKPNNIFST